VNEKNIRLLSELFGWEGWPETDADEKEKFTGRQTGPNRPERSTKAGFKGRTQGLKGRDTELRGRGIQKKEKERVTEFKDNDDWILSMMMVAVMHLNPDMEPDDAINEGMKWAKELGKSGKKHLWRSQAIRMKRIGIRASASKIRREMFKLI